MERVKLFRWWLVLFAVLASLARAQTYQGKTLVEPLLIADTTAIEGGKKFRAGILFKMQPGWHLYWKYAGDSGLAPQIEWTLPQGYSIGELQWPTPKVANEDGDLQVYVYADELLLFATVTPPASVSGQVEILSLIHI